MLFVHTGKGIEGGADQSRQCKSKGIQPMALEIPNADTPSALFLFVYERENLHRIVIRDIRP